MTKKTAANSFEKVIVGSSLGALILANKLQAAGHSVLVLEAEDQFAPLHAQQTWKDQAITNDFAYYFGTAAQMNELEQLQSLLGQSPIGELQPSEIVEDKANSLQEFLGFGDHAPLYYEVIAPYLNCERLNLFVEPSEWVDALLCGLQNKQVLAKVTKLYFQDDEIFCGLQINGSTDFYAQDLIWLDSPRALLSLLPQSKKVAKYKARWSKKNLWSKVGLDLYFAKPVMETSALLVISGNNREEAQPILGYCRPSAGAESPQVWQWLGFVAEEVGEDPEAINAILKRMRKLIKRHLPIDEAQERIVVIPESHGTVETKDSEWVYRPMEKVYFSHFTGWPEPGLLSELTMASEVIQALDHPYSEKAPPRSKKKEEDSVTDLTAL